MQVVFSGKVSAQVSMGQIVTLTVTKPDASKEMFDVTTLADGSYSIIKTYDIAGNYSVTAHVDADSQYKAAESAPFPFAISLQDRTVTVSVSIT